MPIAFSLFNLSTIPLLFNDFVDKRDKRDRMEITDEDGNSSSSLNFEYKGAHQAFRDRWKETDDTMCRHSMSFHLHHTLRSEFFASYLYLLEKTPLGKIGHRKVLKY